MWGFPKEWSTRCASRPKCLAAYDYFLRGKARIYDGTRDANIDALQNFERAIEIDPNFASAYGMCAYCHVWREANGWLADKTRAIAEAERLARMAARLGPYDAVALAQACFALASSSTILMTTWR